MVAEAETVEMVARKGTTLEALARPEEALLDPQPIQPVEAMVEAEEIQEEVQAMMDGGSWMDWSDGRSTTNR